MLAAHKADLIHRLTFRGQIFDAFAGEKSGSDSPNSELAARYRVLLNLFRRTSTDERLCVLAQWAWAEMDILPEDSIGVDAVKRLSVAETKRVNKIPFNDLRYAMIVRAWLPYVNRLFNDASAKSKSSSLEKSLLSLGYDQLAVDIFTAKRWFSPSEFICAWLSARGEIAMVKAKKDPDQARTLSNAYSRIFGRRGPHILDMHILRQASHG